MILMLYVKYFVSHMCYKNKCALLCLLIKSFSTVTNENENFFTFLGQNTHHRGTPAETINQSAENYSKTMWLTINHLHLAELFLTF